MTKILKCNWCGDPFYDQRDKPIEPERQYDDYDHDHYGDDNLVGDYTSARCARF